VGSPDSEYLTGSGCLWTKGNDFAGGADWLPPAAKECFQVAQTPDHLLKGGDGLGNDLGLVVNGDE